MADIITDQSHSTLNYTNPNTPTPSTHFQTPTVPIKRNSWAKEEKDLFFNKIQKMSNPPNLNQLFACLGEVIVTKTPAKIRDFYYRRLRKVKKLLNASEKHIDERLNIIAMSCYGKLMQNDKVYL